MKRFAIVLLTTVIALYFAGSVFAGNLKPGQKTSCKNANSISLTAQGTSSKGDRTNANAVLWKSSNFTTIPITLGPGENQYFKQGAKGLKMTGVVNRHSMGQKAVVLKKQSNFSRGDSIGDISGEVRITNVGTIDINVKCG